MLGKLLKYDLKAGARLMPIAYAAVALLCLMSWILNLIDISPYKEFLSIILILISVAIVFASMIYSMVRYYRGVYGAEGYLTQTLPVKHSSIVISKVISAFIFYVISFAVAFGGVYAGIYFLGYDLLDLFRDMSGNGLTPLVWYVAVSLIISFVVFISETFFSITLAQIRPFMKNNIIFAVLFYFGLNFIVPVLEFAGILFIPLGIKIGENGASFTTEMMVRSLDFSNSAITQIGIVLGAGSYIIDIAAGVCLLVLTAWLMRTKTSVK